MSPFLGVDIGLDLSEASSMTIIVTTLGVIVGFVLVVRIVNCLLGDFHIPIRDTKHHSWSHVKLSSRPRFCSVCENLILSGQGVCCDCCGVCADTLCVKKASRKLQCKAMTLTTVGQAMKHHWVKGNLRLGALCEVCDEDCGTGPGLIDLQCCWCHLAVHTKCIEKLSEICDFGRYRALTVPPGCVQVSNKRRSVRKNLQLRSVTPTGWPDWAPLIVLANRRSGNKDGDAVLAAFRHELNPAQVVDLADRPPEVALEWCSLMRDVTTTLLVAGGDGTVGWVLDSVSRMQLDPSPRVAILPLGTGNDLSRVLGWGSEHPADLDASVVLDQIRAARETKLDRWAVEIRSSLTLRHLGMRLPARNMFMYNYLSVGVDAQVTLDFHRTRESPFYIFSHRIFNKLLYLGFGTQQVMERGCKDLDQRLELYMDGRKIDLPAIESVVILNIPSWGAGVRLWTIGAEEGEAPEQSFNDGLLEVVAIFSSFHIAQLQVGLSQPLRLGQAREVRLEIKAPAPMQVDGEPWVQAPASINVTFHDQATVLQRD